MKKSEKFSFASLLNGNMKVREVWERVLMKFPVFSLPLCKSESRKRVLNQEFCDHHKEVTKLNRKKAWKKEWRRWMGMMMVSHSYGSKSCRMQEGRRDGGRVRRGRERRSDRESEGERSWWLWTSLSQIYVRLSLRTNINLDTKQIKAWTLPLPKLSTLFIIRLSLVKGGDNLHVGPNFLPGQSLYHTNCVPNTTRVKDLFSG